MSIGAQGVISVASNIIPGVISKLCEQCMENNFTIATELYAKYSEFLSVLFIETNPMPLKAAMKALDMDSGEVRLPLTTLGGENHAKLISVMRETGLNV